MINDSTSQPPEPKAVNFVLVESPARTKIFISHTSSDELLATALVNCLLSSMILEDGDIRCTSVPGHKLPVGSDFASTLRDDIGDSSVVIGAHHKERANLQLGPVRTWCHVGLRKKSETPNRVRRPLAVATRAAFWSPRGAAFRSRGCDAVHG